MREGMSGRKIVRFETDDEGHWRAELECGHFQHVRHRPPLESREWISNSAERDRRIGVELKCAKCDEEKNRTDRGLIPTPDAISRRHS